MEGLEIAKDDSYSVVIAFLLALVTFQFVFPVQTVYSAVVVHPYDWAKPGTYVRYYMPGIGIGLVYPNGTQENLPPGGWVALQWTILNRTGNDISLNVTFAVQSKTHLDVPVNYTKTLFINVDLYTRESTLDGESIGKTFFWAEPYQEVGDNVTLVTNPDLWIGKGWRVVTSDSFGLNQTIKHTSVGVRQEEPNAVEEGVFCFSYYTGACLYLTLVGAPWTVPPELYGNFIGRYENGTEYNVTRYSGMKIGELLGVAPVQEFGICVNETNIDVTLQTQPESPDPQPPLDNPPADTNPSNNQTQTQPNEWQQYFPYMAGAAFAAIVSVTIISRRRRHTAK